MALRTGVAKVRVMTNWILNAVAGDDYVRTGFQARRPARLRDFEYTDSYLTKEQIKQHTAALHARHQ
jgi:NADH dehydrogenase